MDAFGVIYAETSVEVAGRYIIASSQPLFPQGTQVGVSQR